MHASSKELPRPRSLGDQPAPSHRPFVAKIADFGLSKVVALHEKNHVTAAAKTNTLGTIPFM